MLQKVNEFSSQLNHAYSRVNEDPSIRPVSGKISSIVIAGMGASGVIGDFIRVILKNSHVPVIVLKSASLPSFVNSESLVISITYSGRTRETLDVLSASMALGARNLVITSSAKLGSFCSSKGIPWVQVPENGFPRATLGFMLVSALAALHKLGVAGSFDADVSEATQILGEIRSQCGPEMPHKTNPARLLAQALVGSFPIIYGESGFTEVVAVRWKQQINENGKAHCYYDVFPELLHNEVESWHLADNGQVKQYVLLLMRDSSWEADAGMEGKIEATKRLAEGKGTKVVDLWTKGRSELARLLSLCYVGDYVSVYLSILRGIDPGPVHNIEQLKKISISNAKEV